MSNFRGGGRVLALVLLLTFLAFSPVLFAGFTNWDDQIHLLENPLVIHFNLSHIWHILNSVFNLTYVPLTILSFSFEHFLFGFNPFFFHLDNLLLHLSVTAMVFAFARRLGLEDLPASLAALVFGIHPIHVEAVAWVSARKDVLYGFFYMLALLSYGDFLKLKMSKHLLASLAWGTLSILAKPMALSLPLVLVLLDRFHGRRDWGNIIKEKVPFVAVFVPIAAITFVLNRDILGLDQDPWHAALILAWTLGFYLQKFLFPFVLVPDYVLPMPVSIINPAYGLTVVFLLALLLFWVHNRKIPFVNFAFLFFLASLFFLLRAVNASLGLVADRFMYMPSIGFCLLAGFYFQRLQKKAVKAVIVLALCLGLKTFIQCHVWNDSITLWNYVLIHTAPKAFYYQNRGQAYARRGDWKLALRDYQRALAMDPKLDEVLYDRAGLYLTLGQYDKAIKDYGTSIKLYPYSSQAYNNRGVVYRRLGKYDLALKDFDQAIKFDHRLVLAFINRARTLIVLGRYDMAMKDLNRVLELDPDALASTYNLHGFIYMKRNQDELALADFSRALRIYPEYDAYINRAIVYRKRDQFDLALADFDKALKSAPHEPSAYLQRGLVYLLQGDNVRAIADFTKAIGLDKFNAMAYNARGLAFNQMGQKAKAQADFAKARSLGFSTKAFESYHP